MRAILGSYDSELTPAEYSPQLTRRMREAEDMVQKVHAHSSEMEVRGPSVRARSAGVGGRCGRCCVRTSVLLGSAASRPRGTASTALLPPHVCSP